MNVHFGASPRRRRGDPRGLRPAACAALLSVGLVSFGVPALAPRAALAQSAGTFSTAANPGGGEIMTGTLGTSSLAAATAALLRRVHTALGSRPAVVQVARNARDHSLALLFTATHGGTPYTGIALVTAAPGAQAGGAVLYDTAARFHATVGPMLRRLNAMTTPSAASSRAAVTLAPAEPLVTHAFRDGTGSIGVPADWKLEVYGGGSAMASGPTGEIVAYNMAWAAIDMSNPRAQYFMRSQPPQMRENFLHRVALLPYTSDPVQAWLTVPNQLAKQRGGFQPHFAVKSATTNGNMADIVATVVGKKASASAHIVAHALVLPPNPNGQWTLTNVFISVHCPLGFGGSTKACATMWADALAFFPTTVATMSAMLPFVVALFTAKCGWKPPRCFASWFGTVSHACTGSLVYGSSATRWRKFSRICGGCERMKYCARGFDMSIAAQAML